ncbi:PIG-L family deacetylase [Rossellomorea vietnamensis]|uniref:PIG-L family deacetylase n=1 Tax=Rossellomorea aquimaris TaxID=189382 RepID=A0A5D4TMW6_9BACI|nr:PIG-L family deacetylase [Rossellomorea aquimaris]TYS75812.1 PIG-L family deacetylase [Rossellomorea aquimaris]
MKTFCSLLLILAYFLSMPLVSIYAAKDTANKPVAIFYSPHQDDELLSMGNGIIRYVDEGYEVHVVLLTRGGGSNAIHSINEKLKSAKLSSLSKTNFTRARNREFTQSVISMGVPRENIHFSRLRDGQTTTDDVNEVVLKFKSRFPDAEHKALSYHDDHIDHRNSGLALKTLYTSGMISSPKFYIQNVEHHLWEGKYEPFDPSYQYFIDEATLAYHTWSPRLRYYSVGGISVVPDFLQFKEDPRSKYHLLEK